MRVCTGHLWCTCLLSGTVTQAAGEGPNSDSAFGQMANVTTRWGVIDDPQAAFEMMKDLSNDLGVSVLGEEARTIRKRSSYILEQLEPNKRAKIGADTVSVTPDAFPSNEDEPTLKELQMQQLVVWKQTFRVERMVRLLSNLEEVMKLFIQELNDIKSGGATTIDSTKLAAPSNRAA